VDWACELLGTALLILGGLSAVVLDFGSGSPVARAVPSHSLRLLITGTLFASCGALVTISPLGRRSGAHLNPAVTLAFWCHGHVRLQDLFGYALSQAAGAVAGAFAVHALWGTRATSVEDGLTHPGHGFGPLAAAGLEAVMTALLVLTIFAFVSSRKTMHWTPLAVAAVVALLVWQGAPYTGTSLNPARSLGPAVVSGRFTDYWVYVAGPLSGALLAAGIWVLVPLETLTAKLFHDKRYRSVFASALPAKR
jgi:aquaporin Z